MENRNEYVRSLFYSPDQYLESSRPDLLEDSETYYLANELKLAREALLLKIEGEL